jgi:hypothetical protein
LAFTIFIVLVLVLRLVTWWRELQGSRDAASDSSPKTIGPRSPYYSKQY